MAMIGVHAALEKRRREHEEEEVAGYGLEDLAEGWEFKIVRSAMGDFGKPEMMRAMIQGESAAGWQLLEKLDNGRVRLKRPVAARERDAMLPKGVDPYRTTYGWSEARVALTIMAGIALSTVGILVAIWAANTLLGAT
jgi:hypothetical protein